MNCEGITNKLRQLQSNDAEIIDLFGSDSIERLQELFREQIGIVLEILVSFGDYSSNITSRELVVSILDYDYVSSFSEGRAWGFKGDRTELINDEGNVLRSFNYRSFNSSPFIDGTAVVSYDKASNMLSVMEYWLINRQGEKIAGPFSSMEGEGTEKILCFRKKDKLTREFVRRDGTEIKDVTPVTPFSENRAWIEAGDGSAALVLVDEEFSEITRRHEWKSATSMSCKRTWVTVGDTVYDLINDEGKLVKTIVLSRATPFKEGYSVVSSMSGKIYFVSEEGEMVFGQHMSVAPFSEGVAVVQRQEDGRYIYISSPSGLPRHTNDLQGYNEASSFSEGFAVILENPGDYYFIDHHGDNPFNRHFEFATDFEDGVAKVGIDGKDYWIDHSGKIVFGPVEKKEE